MFQKLFRRSKSKKTVSKSALDKPIINLSEYDNDVITLGNMCEGTIIFGGTGSGKTSGSGQCYSNQLLCTGIGGLVLCAKKDEVDLWLKRAKSFGRLDDVIVFDNKSDCYFNFIDYEFTRSGEGAGQTENIINLFFTVMEAGKKGGSNSNQFFEDSAKDLMRNAIDLCKLSGESLSIKAINDIILTAPQDNKSPPDLSQYCVQLIKRMSERNEAGELSVSEVHDKEITFNYWAHKFPSIDKETRSNIVATFDSFGGQFARGELYQRFCTKTTITPEETFDGKIIIMNYPFKEWGAVGEYAQVLFKTMWQDAIERRDLRQYPLPVFLWVDECQFFLTSNDQPFLTTARSARAITVYLSQNIPNLTAKLGSHNQAAIDSLLGNFQTKIFHQNSDIKTNEWASNLIGTADKTRGSYGTSGIPDAVEGQSVSNNFQTQKEALINPNDFALLRKGGASNNYEVDAILYQGGRMWQVSGQCFMSVTFNQIT